ncbi:MAG: protein kinase [Minicystis sp.]
MVATCAQCGASSPADAAFCGGCGAPIAPGTVPGSPLSAAVRPADPLPAPPPPDTGAVVPGPLAGAPAKRAHLPIGTLIDKKYAVVRVLGEGGMGVVYLARDIHTGLDVVVKAVRSELAHRNDVRQRTLAEGRALAQIDHPNVVHLRAVVVDGPNLWLVMQYIDGESLDKTLAGYVARGENMPVEEALGVLRQVASGVGAAHEEGVIHRDLKPANVLIRKKDHVAKVTDFGIAKMASEQPREQTKGIIGSLWYMSPEQVTGRRDLDLRVDIYALGIVLYQLLVGHVPFDATSDYEIMRLHAEAPMPFVKAARPDIPPEVDALIQKACAKDRDQRFQTCAALVTAIDRILERPARTVTLNDPISGLPAVSGEHAAARSSGPPAQPTTSAEAKNQVGGTTTGGAAVAVKGKRSGGKWIIAVVTLLVLGGAAAVVVTQGVIPGVGPYPPRKPTTGKGDPTKRDGGAPAPTTSAAPARSPIEQLAGPWVINGKDFDAVLTAGETLEFRVKTAAQFSPQDYEAGEARFVLRATTEANVYNVEDRLRPFPPQGMSFAPASRNSCQESWTTVEGAPLKARFDGKRLTIDLAKIEPKTEANFTVEGGKTVTGCRALKEAVAGRLANTASRP